jgi:hypothetical protein
MFDVCFLSHRLRLIKPDRAVFDLRAQVRKEHDGINRHEPRGSCIEPVPLPGPSGVFASARLPWGVFKLFAQRLIVAEVCELGG